jgi:hypothetical protein
VLHFDQDQLVWECNELTACEHFPAGMGDLIPEPKMRTCLQDTFRAAQETGLQGRELFDVWKPIVRTYSAAMVTRDSDRLVALHGVAMRVGEVLGCRYAAGLFGRNMESQLLWDVVDNKTSTRTAEHVAPSWSWASIVGGVSMLPQWDPCEQKEYARKFSPEEIQEQYLCEILHKDEIGSRDCTPTVSYEALEVRCYLSPVHYVSASETEKWTGIKYELRPKRREIKANYNVVGGHANCSEDDNEWPLELRGNQWTLHEGTTHYLSLYRCNIYSEVFVSSVSGNEPSAFYLQAHHDIAAEYKTRRERWLMPVYSVTEREPVDVFDMNRVRTVNGLILERREEDGGKFRRCGTFKVKPENQKLFWRGCFKYEGDGLKREKCDGVVFPDVEGSELKYVLGHGVPQYLISIV